MKTLALFLVFLAGMVNAYGQAFREEEVSISNGDVTLSGTLSFPESPSKKIKAVILISGSGPQNRDSEILGMKPFKLLADFFNAEGFAVLRYDDRGTGKSTGKPVNESTTADLADDALQAYKFLLSRKEIDPKGIGLLGHSEGGIVAPIVAAQEPSVAFTVLLAGFGVKGVELSNAQQSAILRASGMSEEFIKTSGDLNREVMRMMQYTAVTESQLSEFVKTEMLKLLPLLPESIQAQIPDKEGYASMAAAQAIAQLKSPWIRYYMNYDPLPALKKVKCPVLLMFGELDTQVLASQNSKLMEDALLAAGNKKVTAITLAKANHLFQEALTGSPTEYSTLKKEFTPEFLPAIRKWLNDVKIN